MSDVQNDEREKVVCTIMDADPGRPALSGG